MRALAVTIATVGGLGYAPAAPGTCASLAAVPLVPALGALHARWLPAHAALVAAVVALAVWAAGRADAAFVEHDRRCIVVDELAGMLLGSLCVPGTWLAAAVLFAFFRLFDIWKPYPAGLIDRRCPGGLGVVGDDLVAGLYAGLATRAVLGAL